jgi:hypothetical protein
MKYADLLRWLLAHPCDVLEVTPPKGKTMPQVQRAVAATAGRVGVKVRQRSRGGVNFIQLAGRVQK